VLGGWKTKLEKVIAVGSGVGGSTNRAENELRGEGGGKPGKGWGCGFTLSAVLKDASESWGEA
jgi:hypothetical protein